ncbi:hypothetical protein ETB97_010073 [Aspergillus alliaceus]|uniref:Zn(2)-C6 fungal-type domain-containing protein n=1 Tax=Petromyces alliaceus TaxID=209559 RepID=A0A8H6AA35_PETAA|nr:hypothetical protein ETB97_010073 [Aspergillus burnettii]
MATRRKTNGPRSRSGCITCKLRHVKCDEAKPSCSRCQRTGLKCDGYDNASQSQLRQRMEAIQHQPRRPPISADHQIILRPETREERRCADFFHAETTQAFSGFFDSTLWSYLIPQISEGEPMIRHAMIAIGAFHAGFEDRALVDTSFALQQYNKAIRHLIDRKSVPSSQDWELALAACCLFIGLEILRGNKKQALDHIDAGLKMLCQHELKGAAVGRTTEVYGELRQLLSRLNLQASFMGRLLYPLECSSQDAAATGPTLANLSQARRHLDRLMNKGLMFIRSTDSNRNPQDVQLQQKQVIEQRELCLEFDNWLAALNKLVQKMGPWIQQKDLRASLVLRIYHRVALIWIRTVLAPDEGTFDLYIPDFDVLTGYAERAIQLTTAIEKQTNNQSRFSLEGELIATLYFSAVRCRNPGIRRRAIDLLSRYGKIEGMWNAKRYAAVATYVMETEEGACSGIVKTEKDVGVRARIYECIQPSGMEQNPCQVILLFKLDGGGHDFQRRIGFVHW